jgi:outer membrane lipoprotein carrier protein
LKYILLLLLTSHFLNADLINLNSFKADFIQTVKAEKGNELEYKGSLVASKPQNMLWNYRFPAKKDIIIKDFQVTIIEYDIEQVLIKHINSNFNFFKILKHAKQVDKNTYIALFNDIKYTLKLTDAKISSISYLDELDNKILITFTKQEENKEIDPRIFTPIIPLDFDIIRE